MYRPLPPSTRRLLSIRLATWTKLTLLAMLIAVLPSSAQQLSQPLSEPTMLGPSHGHSATRLPDGTVLIAGGENANGTISGTSIFDGTNFVAGPALFTSRKYHTATLLSDGQVLIAGGQNQGSPLGSTEVFNPATTALSAGPLLQTPRSGHSATVLADGRVVIIGGDTTGSVEIFDPTTRQFTLAPATLATPRAFHSAALLQDGKILIVGGAGGDNKSLDTGEVYDPATRTFTAVGKAMHTARLFPVLEVLPDGKVQVLGGSRDYSMEIYDPQLNAFGAYSDWLVNDQTTTDEVLQARTRAALFHNAQDGALVGALTGMLDREEHTVTALQDNKTLIAGGLDSNEQPLNTAVVVSSSPATVSTSKTDYAPGEYVTITGTGWQAGENVSLFLHEEPTHHDDAQLLSTADQAGNFTNSDYEMEEHDAGVTYTITAKGQNSGFTAQTAFTDGTPTRIQSSSMSPNSGSCGSTITVSATLEQKPGSSFIPLPSKTVNFTLGSSSNSGITNVNGIATATLTVPSGATSLVAAFAGDSTYNAVSTNLSFTVTGSCISSTTLTVSPANGAYGGTTPLSATLKKTSDSSGVNGKTISFTLNGASVGSATTNSSGVATLGSASLAGINAGTYATGVGASFSGDSSFSASSGTNSLTVTPKTATVAANAKSKTYGDDNPTLDAIVTGTLNGDTLNYTLATTAAKFSSVGSYPITITLGSNPNYTVSKTDSTLTVNAKTATIVANAKSKTYGDDNPALDAVVTGAVNGDTLNYSLATIALKFSNVGSYPIMVLLGSNPNYTVTKTDSTLTISAKAATVAANAKSKTYGDDNPTLTATVSGTVDTDTLNYSLTTTAAKFSNVDGYPITVTLGSNPNYTVTSTDSTLTISAKTATVAANAKSKTYGDDNPALDAVVTGEATGGDSITYTLATSALKLSNVGSYPITVTLGSNPNYTVNKTDSTLTVNKALATVVADAKSKTYGDDNPGLTAVVTGEVTGGNPIAYTLATTAVKFSGVGSYPITVSLGSNLNYFITTTDSTLTITKALASVSAVANSKTYGTVDPTLATTNSGFLTGDVGAGKITFSATRTAGETVANTLYTITPSASDNGTGLLDNYTIAYNTAAFTITKATASVTPDAKTKVYGASDPTLTGALVGFLAADGVTATYSRTAGETVLGSPYIISATLSPSEVLSNYDITYNTAAFTITSKAASVTPNVASKTYGDADPTFAGMLSGFLAADGVTATYSRTTGEIVGLYIISATLSPTTVLTNYDITYNTALFTIDRAPLYVNALTSSKTYGASDPSFSSTLSGFQNGETATTAGVTGVALCSRTAGETVAGSPYTITCAPGALTAANYSFVTGATAPFTITKATASVTPNVASKTYGATDPAFTGTLSGFLAADGVTATYSRTAGETVLGSPYTISATLAPVGALSNYDITYSTAAFTITKADPTVTATGNTCTYDGNPCAGSGSAKGVFGEDLTPVNVAYKDGVTPLLAAPVNAGTYAVAARYAGDSNYNPKQSAPATITINKATASVTPDAKTKVYGSSDPAFTGTLSGFLAADSVTASYSRTSGETVAGGPYTISAALAPASVLDNYIITYNTATFTITPKAAMWTTNNNSKIYGATDPTPLTTGSSSGFLAADGVTATYSRAAGETAGTYHINATLSPAGVLANYNITNAGATFTIDKATLTVTADQKTKILNAPNPSFTFQITGFQNGDSSSVVTTQPNCTSTATQSSPVGQYDITCSNGAAANYVFTYVKGALSIQYATGGMCNGELGHTILQPINTNGSSVFKLGSTVPTKFRVCDANGVSISTPGIVTAYGLVAATQSNSDLVNELTYSTTPDTTFRWDPTAQQWIFNQSTKNNTTLKPGVTYIFQINLNDGSYLNFSYKLK